MKLITHLSFNGQCEEAFHVYERCLGGAITSLVRYGETPSPATPEMRDRIAHITLKVEEQTLTGADVAPDGYHRPQGFAVQLNLSDPGRAGEIFRMLADGGEILVPMGRTFWADRYGMVTDRFGTPWEINCSSTIS